MDEAHLFKTLNLVLSTVKLHIFSNKKYYLLSSQFHKTQLSYQTNKK